MSMSIAASADPGARAAPREDVWTEVIFLGLASAVLVLSLILQTRGPALVVIPGIETPLPETCGMRKFTGLDCPGCGLTRSFIRLAHGDLAGAWGFHPIGPFVFALVAIQIPYRSWQIWRSRSGRGLWRPGWWIHVPLGVIITLMIARWVVRLVGGDLGAGV